MKLTLNFTVNFLTHAGIAHTRWATHGEPNWVNTHPQRSDLNSGMWIFHGIAISAVNEYPVFVRTKIFG